MYLSCSASGIFFFFLKHAMYVFMKPFMNKLVFRWSERGLPLQSLTPPLLPTSSSKIDVLPATGQQGAVLNEISLAGDFASWQTDGGWGLGRGQLQSCLEKGMGENGS